MRMKIKLNRFFLFGAIVICSTRASRIQAQNSVSDCVDWTSAPSVLAHIERLVSQYGTAETIPLTELSNIVVSADCLWTNCLDFTILTNDFTIGKQQVAVKKESLRIISRMDSFSRNAQNRSAALAMMNQIKSLRNVDMGNPLPYPVRINRQETISTNDSPGEVQRKTLINELAASNHAASVSAYFQDQAKRLFYRELRFLNLVLDVYISSFSLTDN